MPLRLKFNEYSSNQSTMKTIYCKSLSVEYNKKRLNIKTFALILRRKVYLFFVRDMRF